MADRVLFDGLDLQVARGESVAVTGASGSGKSTLLSCVLGLIKPGEGTVAVTGTPTTGLSGKRMARVRSESIGMVFQFGELLPELTPVENVALAPLLSRTATTPSGDPKSEDPFVRAEGLLTDLGVPVRTATSRLSGGERQRTAVARALMNAPGLLLADEPTGALDADTRELVADLLFSLPRRHSCGLLVVTHDVTVAQRADRVLHLRHGRLTPADRASAPDEVRP
ncbi:ABC transporter ATP-binding protein [Streptomyces iconiensis]|uniref:ABC transporter ATP-binding protein n=1 Tax=Streptomyces iconiensis TaxID=1384038 RepID=UPI003D2F597D